MNFAWAVKLFDGRYLVLRPEEPMKEAYAAKLRHNLTGEIVRVSLTEERKARRPAGQPGEEHGNR